MWVGAAKITAGAIGTVLAGMAISVGANLTALGDAAVTAVVAVIPLMDRRCAPIGGD